MRYIAEEEDIDDFIGAFDLSLGECSQQVDK